MFYYYFCVQIKPLIFPVWGMWRSTLDKMPLSSVWQLDVPMKQRSFCWRWLYSRFLVFSENYQVLSNSIIISQRLKFWLAASQQNDSTKMTQSTWMVMFKNIFFFWNTFVQIDLVLKLPLSLRWDRKGHVYEIRIPSLCHLVFIQSLTKYFSDNELTVSL